MDEEAIFMQRTLEDLARLHDQIVGRLELEHQTILLGEWLPKVLSPWQQAAREKRLDWQEAIPPDLPPISADPLRLAQVVGNLVDNAIRYTAPGGSVRLSAGEKDGSLWFEVADTGPGIPAEEQGLIFNPFYRGDQGRTIKQGMGLGLSIAHDLAVAHGGSITVESAPGLGSRFTLWLPENLEQGLT
jgi:signal transduction histidine kinase